MVQFTCSLCATLTLTLVSIADMQQWPNWSCVAAAANDYLCDLHGVQQQMEVQVCLSTIMLSLLLI